MDRGVYVKQINNYMKRCQLNINIFGLDATKHFTTLIPLTYVF